MTEKELLYTEDAIGHENTIIKLCEDIISNLEDSNLKDFMSSEVDSHNNMKQRLLDLLKENTNE